MRLHPTLDWVDKITWYVAITGVPTLWLEFDLCKRHSLCIYKRTNLVVNHGQGVQMYHQQSYLTSTIHIYFNHSFQVIHEIRAIPPKIL